MDQRVSDLMSRSATHRNLLSSIKEGTGLYEELEKNYAQRLKDTSLQRLNPSGRMNVKMGYREPKHPLMMALEGRELEPIFSGFKISPAKGLGAFDDSIDASLERVIATISGIRTVEKEAVQTSAHLAGGAMKRASGKMMGHASQASRAVAAGTKGSKNLRFSSAAAKLFKARF